MKSFNHTLLVLSLAAVLWLCLSPLAQGATMTVTNTADSGAGSLRDAIAAANPGDIIVFSNTLAGQTIQLTSGELIVTNNLTIDASALSNGIVIDGEHNSRVLENLNTAVTLNSLTLSNGYSTNGGAGGVEVGGVLIASNCVFTDNIATNDGGGGMSVGHGPITLNNCIFSGNSAPVGGGIFGAFAADITLNGCTFSNNTSPGGGAISTKGTGTFNNCMFSGNSSREGGAIIIADGGTYTLNNCTLTGNSATNAGGAIENAFLLTLNNCTLTGNSVKGSVGGGAIYCFGPATILNNCTICSNSAAGGAGGGLFYDNSMFSGVFALTNTIVAGNTASTNADIFGAYSGMSDFVGGDPQLAPLGNYGGPTLTMSPLFGSPVIDAGTDEVTNFLTTDQRGFPRLIGAHVDIGAVEAQTAPANNGPVLRNPVWVSVGSGRSFQFTFTNVTEADFTVLTSTNVALPLTDWTILGNVLQNSLGQYQFTDSEATNSAQFYGVISP